MQKYEETHQIVISRESERKKKKQEKMQFKWESRNESN